MITYITIIAEIERKTGDEAKILSCTKRSRTSAYDYLVDIDKQAEEMFSRLIKQMAEHEGVTEKLKADNQMKWVVQMNNIRSRASEIVNNDLINTQNRNGGRENPCRRFSVYTVKILPHAVFLFISLAQCRQFSMRDAGLLRQRI